jgi:lactate dehydrogenase-like 2-hydroxyacid dehydrogenase
MDNVVLLPHIGGATVRSLSMMRELVLRNLDQYLSYGTLTTPVIPANRHVHNGIHKCSGFSA